MSSVRWAESRKGRQLVTTTQNVNLKNQIAGGQGGLVSYEDLLIAQYRDELRTSKPGKPGKTETNRPSPYTQKLPHSDYTYKYRIRHRPLSASNACPSRKPKIDAKFIADPSLWDPSTPRKDEGLEKYQSTITEKMLKPLRPESAPAKMTKLNRPFSAASTMSSFGRSRPSSAKITYFCGKRIRSQYRKKFHIIRVTAFINGSREPFVRLAAPNIRTLLEYCTEKFKLPFAARRVFLEDGVEVFDAKDIPQDGEVYISSGESYRDPYATVKRDIMLSNGAKWTLTGVMLPDEGKKKVSKPRLSKRMKKLTEVDFARIVVYRNGTCTEPVEIVANLKEPKKAFLAACTAKLDLRKHAKILYNWEGNKIRKLTETQLAPLLQDCLQYEFGPVWVSTGENFIPSGIQNFLITIIKILRSQIEAVEFFIKELTFMRDGEEDEIKKATKILSMTPDEVEEALIFAEDNLEQLNEMLEKVEKQFEKCQEDVEQEQREGSNYRLQHIFQLSEDQAYKMLGKPGMKLKVHENGTNNCPRDFFFNLRKASQGSNNQLVLQRFLDEVSGMFVNPQNPKLAPIAKKIFNQFGQEVKDIFSLKTDDEVWISFGEPYISLTTYALQVIFDIAKGRYILGGKEIVLREQFTPDDSLKKAMSEHENYKATTEFPSLYVEPSKNEPIGKMAEMAELDIQGHFLEFQPNKTMVLYPEIIMNRKLPKGHKGLWPSESQTWVISKSGFIFIKPFPQLCLAVSETTTEMNIVGRDFRIKGYVVTLQKKKKKEKEDNAHQIWKFNPDATVTPQAYPDLLLTYIGEKFDEKSTDDNQDTKDVGQPEDVKTDDNQDTKDVGQPEDVKTDDNQDTKDVGQPESMKSDDNQDTKDVGQPESMKSDDNQKTTDVGQPKGVKPGSRVYLLVSDPLSQSDKKFQRFALKQERLDKIGQWKYNDSTNPEWNKQALSWPVKADGSLNLDYDWPMEGYILPFAPKLHKKVKDHNGLTGMSPLRLLVLKNGERNVSMAVPVVGPNLTNFMKDLAKTPTKSDNKKNQHVKKKAQEEQDDTVELDINLHCRKLTVRELEFIMFLGHCTSLLNLPFAGRRLFDQSGTEHFSLKTLKRDQVVYVSCGEVWADPQLSKMEQLRRQLLSQLSQDVAKIRQYAALCSPEGYVLQVDPALNPGSLVIIGHRGTKDVDQQDFDRQSLASGKPPSVDANLNLDTDENAHGLTNRCHEIAHEKSEMRMNNLKWPWERLVNVNNSFDIDPESQKFTDKELYQKFKPKPIPKMSLETLQKFVYEDGYISLSANHDLVLGVSEPEGRVVEVHLVQRRPDDIYQQWLMKENGEIRPRYNNQVLMTVSLPSNEPVVEDEEGRPLTFIGCKVTLQTRRTNEFGKAHQKWHYDADTEFIHAFQTSVPDKEITAANKADVCTFAITNTTKIDQPGYLVEVPLQTVTDHAAIKLIKVCISCARAMRGRYRLHRLPENTQFFCAMGRAKLLKLQPIGTFRVLNGKVDLSTHEYKLTLQEWEETLSKLMAETNSYVISKVINVARTVQTVKVLAYKNGEGRLRPGEIICGSSVIGILSQCTSRLGLNQAAARMYTENGTLIVDIDDLIDWAIETYRTALADHLESLWQKRTDEKLQRGEGQGQENNSDTKNDDGAGPDNAETDAKETDKLFRHREFLLSKVQLPSKETILRYPIEIWVSSGKPFVPPEVVESKLENRKKRRALRSAVSLELDIEKHVLRQMKGRRLEELNPGEYKGTRNTNRPVVVDGHWEEPTAEEHQKNETVNKLQEHLAEVKKYQTERPAPLLLDMKKSLYKQPDTKRIMAYPNGESEDRRTFIWGDTFQQLLDNATMRLNLWQPAKRLFTMDGNEITSFEEIQRDDHVCVSTGKPFKPISVSMLDIEIKANWSRAHKQYGLTATDVHVEAPSNPKVNVDPFGPSFLALPLTSEEGTAGHPRSPIRPKSAKPTSNVK